MTLATQEELGSFRAVVREVLAARLASPVQRWTTEPRSTFDRSLHLEAARLGWLGIEVPESLGGGGMGYEYVAVVLEELGKVCGGDPYASTALVTGALVACPNATLRSTWLPVLASGEKIAAAVLAGRFDHSTSRVAATPVDGGWALSGVAPFTLDATEADVFLVVAAAGESPLVVLIERGADGLEVRPTNVLDLSRSVGTVSFENVRVESGCVVASGKDAVHVVATVVDRAAVGVACDSLGIADRVLRMTVSYANERVQFGRPIGSFQAVKHQCSNMFVGVEGARAIVDEAVEAVSLANGKGVSGSMAKSYACNVAVAATMTGVQLHGGIGYTWDQGLHLYMKRAVFNEGLYGDLRWHRHRVADLTIAALRGS